MGLPLLREPARRRETEGRPGWGRRRGRGHRERRRRRTGHVGNRRARGRTAAPAAPTPPAAAPTSPAAGADFTRRSVHARSPASFQRRGCRTGLSAIAAPHSPTPATNLMLNRSKPFIDVNSLFHARRSTPVQPHRGRVSCDRFIFSGPVFNTHHDTPDRFQIETFCPVYWTTKLPAGGEVSNEERPVTILNRRNLHQP